MDINKDNYRIIRAQIGAIRNQLKSEIKRNNESIKLLQIRQDEIRSEWTELMDNLEKIGEFEMESEIKFLEEIERNCARCGNLYDKRKSNDTLCPACFTSNA